MERLKPGYLSAVAVPPDIKPKLAEAKEKVRRLAKAWDEAGAALKALLWDVEQSVAPDEVREHNAATFADDGLMPRIHGRLTDDCGFLVFEFKKGE